MKPAIVNYKPRAFLSFYQTIFYISDVKHRIEMDRRGGFPFFKDHARASGIDPWKGSPFLSLFNFGYLLNLAKIFR